MSQTPTLKSYDLARVFALKQKILNDDEIRGFYYTEPTGDDFSHFVDVLQRCLPSGIDRSYVYQSLNYLAGRELTEEVLDEAVWRIAGNVRRLREGKTAPPWNRQASPEWVPLQVMSYALTMTKKRELAVTYTCRILAGSACPLVVEKYWTKKFVSALLAQRLGFSKPWQSYPFRDVAELVNMRFYALLDPQLSKQQPGFERVEIPGSLQKWNQSYIKMRARRPNVFNCPRNFPRTCLCHLCPIGQEECLAAVHDYTYVRDFCPQCNKEAWFNPEFPNRKVCVDCTRNNIFKG